MAFMDKELKGGLVPVAVVATGAAGSASGLTSGPSFHTNGTLSGSGGPSGVRTVRISSCCPGRVLSCEHWL